MPRSSSTYADEGTTAHALAAAYLAEMSGLIDDKDLELELIEICQDEYYNQDMDDHAVAYASYIVNNLTSMDTQAIRVEAAKLDLEPWVPGGFGTCDCLIDNYDELVVVDYKYGKGVKVDVNDNPQLKLYALGALNSYTNPADLARIQTIRMVIIQPRVYSSPQETTISKDELLHWAKETVQPAAAAATNGTGEYKPSEDACRFCRGKAHCPGLAKEMFALAEEFKETISPTSPVTRDAIQQITAVSIDEAAQYLEKARMVSEWLTALQERVKDHLMTGKPVQGFKLVEGRSVRRISDAAAAISRLNAAGFSTEQVTESKLLGITALEKLAGKVKFNALMEGLIYKPSGSPAMVPADDPRPAWSTDQTILDCFDNHERKVNF
jgi:hypothetical protein